jgi:hypothetical protein
MVVTAELSTAERAAERDQCFCTACLAFHLGLAPFTLKCKGYLIFLRQNNEEFASSSSRQKDQDLNHPIFFSSKNKNRSIPKHA